MALPRRPLLLGLLALPACGLTPSRIGPACSEAKGSDFVWLAHRGIHLEIIKPAAALGPGLPPLPAGTAAVAFGFSKRSFMFNEGGTLVELLLGGIPGEGVLEVTPLPAAPQPNADAPVWRLDLPEGGLPRLQRFLADSLARPDGELRVIDRLPGGRVFYAAVPRYSLAYTCNTWAADGLARAGLPVTAPGVLMAGDVLRQLRGHPGFCALDVPAGPRLSAAPAAAMPARG